MATSEDRFIGALRQLADLSVADDVMPALLLRVATLANETIDGSNIVALSTSVDGRLATPVFTHEEAPEIDAAQYQSGEGPCVASYRDGVVNEVPSTKEDRRWRSFSDACLERGIHSTLSVPVISKGETLGALNFYSESERAFDREALVLGTAFSAQAAIIMVNATAYWSAKTLAEQLAKALETRIIIEQAKGILMAGGSTSGQAFDQLRRASQRENRKLHLVAADLVTDTERRAGRD